MQDEPSSNDAANLVVSGNRVIAVLFAVVIFAAGTFPGYVIGAWTGRAHSNALYEQMRLLYEVHVERGGHANQQHRMRIIEGRLAGLEERERGGGQSRPR